MTAEEIREAFRNLDLEWMMKRVGQTIDDLQNLKNFIETQKPKGNG